MSTAPLSLLPSPQPYPKWPPVGTVLIWDVGPGLAPATVELGHYTPVEFLDTKKSLVTVERVSSKASRTIALRGDYPYTIFDLRFGNERSQ
jgi:hypothetical protein